METVEPQVKYEHNSAFGIYKYRTDGSMEVDGEVFSKERVEKVAQAYFGANRIHKPMAVLFWIDCKNGRASSWPLTHK